MIVATIFVEVAVGDIVRRNDSVGQVAACLLEGTTLLVLVESMVLIESLAAGSDKWAVSGHRQLWKADEIMQCLAWHEEPDGPLMVVRQ